MKVDRIVASTYVDTMTSTPDLASAAADADPRTGLRAVRALRRLTEQLEASQVGRARDQGWSWQEIADVLGVSRQAVHKKHRKRG
jgi:DNA-directed RNA polymerase specialized sigma24 family protein